MDVSLHLILLGTRFDIRCSSEKWAAFTGLLWEPFVIEPATGGEAVTIDQHDGSWRVSCGWHPDLVQQDPWLLSNELRHLLVEEALRRSDAIAIHSAAVGKDGRAIVVVGESGAGKTTLSLQLASDGWGYLTDDVVVLDPRGRLLPFPKPLGIKDADRYTHFERHFAGLVWPPPPTDLFLIPPRALGWIDPNEAHEVVAVVFLQRGRDGMVIMEEVSAGRTLADLGPYSRPIDSSSLAVLGAICAGARCARLVSDDPVGAAGRLEELVK